MTRLTEKNIRWASSDSLDKKNLIQNKLADLEDIEDDLGINLTTLFKALKNGFYVITDGYPYNKIEHVDTPMFMFESGVGYVAFYTCDGSYFDEKTKDFGKTWAFTKEELEVK